METTGQNLDLIARFFTDFTQQQLKQLEALESLYIHWNQQVNLVSRKDIGSLYEKHVLHSLSIAAVFDFKPGTRIIDLGTGGGFPGIPLAIYFPEVRFLLVDSIGKKIKAVNSIVESLGLSNVSTRHCRIEDIRDQTCDFIVSRAVASLADLWKWSRPLCCPVKNRKKESANFTEMPGGLICLKGGDLVQEISQSGCRPRLWDISQIFPLLYFKEKYIVFVSCVQGPK